MLKASVFAAIGLVISSVASAQHAFDESKMSARDRLCAQIIRSDITTPATMRIVEVHQMTKNLVRIVYDAQNESAALTRRFSACEFKDAAGSLEVVSFTRSPTNLGPARDMPQIVGGKELRELVDHATGKLKW